MRSYRIGGQVGDRVAALSPTAIRWQNFRGLSMPRSISHLSPRYFWDRAAFAIEQRCHPDHPWLTADAVRLLDQLLKPADIGVEFGSGRSTLWFAKRLRHLTSMEDNREWASKVRGMLQNGQVASKVDYRAIEDAEAYVAQAATLTTARLISA